MNPQNCKFLPKQETDKLVETHSDYDVIAAKLLFIQKTVCTKQNVGRTHGIIPFVITHLPLTKSVIMAVAESKMGVAIIQVPRRRAVVTLVA